jgi:hypothetical protein
MEWPAEGQGSQERLIRAGIRTSRVFWSDDRAIILLPPNNRWTPSMRCSSSQ